MSRRSFIGEPLSRLAVWSSRLAWFALVVAGLSIVIVRSALLEVMPTLATFAAALICAAIAIVLALAAFIVIWRDGLRGIGRALIGLVLGFALLAYPGYTAYRLRSISSIPDVTTDTTNPPRFDVLARQRPANNVAYPGAAMAAQQRAAYPEIAPLQFEYPPKYVYDLTLAMLTKRKWQIADAKPPAPRRDGSIEATMRSTVMGFRDDVVIRFSPAVRNGTRVDIRSAARIGTFDLGANAQRVRQMMEEIDEMVSNAPEPRVEPEKPAPRATPQRRRPAQPQQAPRQR